MLKANYYTAPSEVDLLIFEKLVPVDHYLRRVKATIDFEPLRAVVADCYAPTLGRGADDPVLLLKLSFLQFPYDLSDRDVMREAQVNVAYRFFLDLALSSQLPVASLLAQFRARLGAERFRQVFDQILGQARAQNLVQDRLRLKDATHVIACVAIPATIRLVAQTRERLLAAARPLAPDQVQAYQAQTAQVREATRDLKDQQRLLARVAQLRAILGWADEQAAGLSLSGLSAAAQAEFAAALALAHKVLNDRAPAAKDRLRSAVDPEVRTGQHGAFYDGYLLDVSLDADSELICALDVLPANADEAADTKALIETEEARHGNDIACVSVDAIGFRGDVLRALEGAGGPQVRVYVPAYDWPGSVPGLFTPAEFELSATGEELRCPGNQTTKSRARANRGRAWQFQFRKTQCAACVLRAQCLKPETQKGRTVIKSDYEAEYLRARHRATTSDYHNVRKQHPKIERKLGEMIRWHGGRRVRYRTRTRVKIQYFLIALVVNVKRFVKLLAPSPHPQLA